MSEKAIKRALLSVSDKTGLAELGAALAARGVELVSTGGTAKALRDAGLTVKDVSDLTGFPEMMDGRVKTLHPTVHGGLLALRDNPEHVAAMEAHGIGAIDLVVVNLYPFEATVAKGADRAEVIENIDIGGPSMVRSAAKNHGFVTILTDPADYPTLIAEMEANGGATTQAFRTRMAGKAYARTATYDSAIASWFAFSPAASDEPTLFPETLPLALKRADTLRYGENPHQMAAIYVPQVAGTAGVSVLDDHHRRFLPRKLGSEFERGVGIIEVVVGEFLALQLGRLRYARSARDLRDIDRRRLVRVLAIAQGIGALQRHRQGVGEQRRLVRGGRGEGEPARDRRIVGSGAAIGLACHAGAEGLRGRAAVRVHFFDQRGVIRRVGEDGDKPVVLRG